MDDTQIIKTLLDKQETFNGDIMTKIKEEIDNAVEEAKLFYKKKTDN